MRIASTRGLCPLVTDHISKAVLPLAVPPAPDRKTPGGSYLLRLLFIMAAFCAAKFSEAQLTSGNAFLKGNYVEVGMAPCGSFGSSVNAPAGYHPRSNSGTGQLGFVADVGRDGWGAGSPNFVGDYFLPGTPEEGWGLTVNGANYNNNLVCGTSNISGGIIGYNTSSSEVSATWQGSVAGLSITSRTYIPINALYFVTEVTIRNTSAAAINNIFYMRTVDPDQGLMTPGGSGNYMTTNSIVQQTPNGCNKALVSAASTSGGYYLGLGSIDARARVTTGGFSNRSAAGVWNGTGLMTSGTMTADAAISIAFNVGSLAPNESTTLAYAYILDASQLSMALDATSIGTQVNDVNYIIGNAMDVCMGSTIPISISNPGTYTSWTWSPSTGLNTTTGTTVLATAGAPITYTATGTGPCGMVQIPITLNPVTLPVPGDAGAISGPTSVAPGQASVTYSISPVANATSYVWTLPPGATVTSATSTSNSITFTASNTPICNATVSVKPLNACGSGGASSLVVNPAPTADAVSDRTHCNGEAAPTIAFSGPVSGTTFSWTSSADIGFGTSGTGAIPPYTAANNTTAPLTATLAVTPTANSCTGAPVNFTIAVNPTPTVNQPANLAVCNGAATGSIPFTGPVSGTTFSWSNDNPSIGLAASGSGDLPSFTAVNTTTAPLTATITVTPSANGCTGTPASFTLTVNPTPSVAAVSNQVVCNGAATPVVNFTGPVSGTTYSWSNDNPSIGLAASGTGAIASFTATNTTTAPVSATLTVTPSANSCTGAPTTFTVTVNPTPVVNAVADRTHCNGEAAPAINFTSPVSGSSFSWTSTADIGFGTSGTGAIPSYTAVNTTAAPVSATLTVTPVANGCTGTPSSFTITVNPTPAVNPVSDKVVCPGVATATINFSGTVSGTQYTWSSNNTAIGLAASGTGALPSFTAINNTAAPVSSTITVTPVANGCAGTPVNFVLTVNPAPVVTSAASAVVCNATAQSYTLTANLSGTTFTWSRAAVAGISNAAVSGQTSATISEALINTTNAPVNVPYTIVPAAGGCPGPAFTYTVRVNPTTTVSSAASAVVCNATAQNYTLAASVSGTTFTWSRAAVSGISNAAVSGQTSATITETLVNTTSSPVTVPYTIVPSANGCTGTPFTYRVTVNPTPTVNSVAPRTHCNGQAAPSISFSGPVSGTAYSWTATKDVGFGTSGTGAIPAYAAVNTTASPVTATVTVTPSANGCTGTPSTFTVTVNPTPTVTAVNNQVVCNGSPVAAIGFTGTVSGTTYSWTNDKAAIGLAASGTGNIASFTAVNNTAAPLTATIVVTPAANGCTGNPVSFTITVNPMPSVSQPLDQTVCNGSGAGAIPFTGPVAGTVYNWTNDNPSIGLAASGTGALPSFTAINNTAAPQRATITVTPVYTNKGVTCSGAPRSFTLTVNPTPAVAAVANRTHCNGEAAAMIPFSGPVSGTTFSWTSTADIGFGTSGTGAIPAYRAVNNTTAPRTATITVTPAANGCTGTPRSFTVTVNPTPVVTAVSDQVVCNGGATGAISFSGAVSGTTYSWTNNQTAVGLAASGTGSIASFTGVNNTTAPLTATLTVTPSANGCTGTPVSFAVTVNPTPTVSQPQNQVVCNGSAAGAISFTGPVAGTTYSWTNDNPSIGLAASGSGELPAFTATNPTSAPVSATITVTPWYAYKGGSCSGPSRSFTITVNPTPSLEVVSNKVYCSGTQNAIGFTGPVAGTAYSWTNSNTAIGLPAGGTGNIPSFTAARNTGAPLQATLTVTPSANGCTGRPLSFTITVPTLPQGSIQAPSGVLICPGTPLPLTLSGGASYQWFLDGKEIAGAASATLQATQPGQYSAVLTSPEGCTNPAANKVALSNIARPAVDFSYSHYCEDLPVVFTNHSRSAHSLEYQWEFGDGTQSSDTDPQYTFVNAGSYTVQLKATPLGCAASAATVSQLVTIEALQPGVRLPSLEVRYNHATLVGGRSLTGASYAWSPAGQLSGTNLYRPTVKAMVPQDYHIRMTFPSGCVTTDTLLVTVMDDLLDIPNAFSPNGDGIHDTWVIPYLEDYPQAEVAIFNRYGQPVYQAKANSAPWDGRVKGSPLPVGTYYYVIDLKGGRKKMAGSITILR